VVTTGVVVVATAAVVVTVALPATPPEDAHALTGQARAPAATRASAAARRPLLLVQGRPGVATSSVVPISVGISTTVRDPCVSRTEERYPERRPCLHFCSTIGRYGRHGNYVGFRAGALWVLPALLGPVRERRRPPRLLRARNHAYRVHRLEALGALLDLELDPYIRSGASMPSRSSPFSSTAAVSAHSASLEDLVFGSGAPSTGQFS
jgi:hypothetical protein